MLLFKASCGSNLVRKMARLAGFEPATNGFEARYSIQLSYRRDLFSLRKIPNAFLFLKFFINLNVSTRAHAP